MTKDFRLQPQCVDMPTLFEFLPIGAYRTNADGMVLRANAALVQLSGYTTEAEFLAHVNDNTYSWYVDPNRRSEFKALIERDSAVVNFVAEVARRHGNGHIWVREAAHAVRDENGHLLYYEGTVEDITESHKAQQELIRNEERWKLALESAGDGVWDWYVQTGEEFFSRRCKEIYGFAEDEIPNRADALDGRTHPDDIAQMQRDRRGHLDGLTAVYRNEHRILCKDGNWKWVLTRGMVISRDASGAPLRMVGTHTDISEQKQAQALVQQQANFDTLTSLPNRRLLRQRLDQALTLCKSNGHKLAVLFIDLDHFKEVNDTLGHDSGDRLLVQAAQRIVGCLPDGATVARMGGDEFTVLLPAVQSQSDNAGSLDHTLSSILDALAQAFDIGAEQVFVSASIGVAIYPDDATAVEELLKNADQALYVAKGSGRNQSSFFTPALQQAAQLRARLATDLRVALSQHQFEVVYQPIVHLSTLRIHKAEALLRWHHPQRGSVAPAQFIPIAESSGLILDIGEWVFEQAAQQVARWQQAYGTDFQVSVNKSPVQFHRPKQNERLWSTRLQSMGLHCNSIAIEITEGVLLESNTHVTRQLQNLRSDGLAISLDDFGTGYSSLTYLQKFAIDFIKIDQSFVRNLHLGGTDVALCKAIIVMAHELGMQVIAEGVETVQQRDLLVGMGCDYGQGYLFARPMGASVFPAFMSGWPDTAP